MKKMIILLLCVLVLSTCSKLDAEKSNKPVEELTTLEENQLKLAWSAIRHTDTLSCTSITPIVFEGNIISSKKLCEEGEVFEMRDGQTGELIWTWDQWIIADKAAGKSGVKLYGDKLVICFRHEIYVVDANTGETIWDFALQLPHRGDMRINVFDGFIYHVHRPLSGNLVPFLHMVRSPIEAPSWDTIYTLSMENGAHPFLDAPSFCKTENGDTHLFFYEKYYHFDEHRSYAHLSCYSVAGDSMVWKVENFDEFANVVEPLVYEDKVFATGHHTIYCFDNASGEPVWQKAFEETQQTFASHAPMIVEDLLLIKPDDGSLYGFDPHKGHYEWGITDTGANCDQMAYHNGVVYFTCMGSNYLHGVDIYKGEEVLRQLPVRSAFGSSGVAIDQEQEQLFATSKKEILCYDLSIN